MNNSSVPRLHRGVCAGVAGALMLFAVTGGALAQDADEVNDPLEDFNRAIFEFNRGFDKVILKPLAEGYRFVLPEQLRDVVKSFLDNLRTPIILANDLLQGKFGRAGITLNRFLFNSTFGIGGLVDIAGDLGMPGHDEDFGQTLGWWGAGEGFYLVLPIFGSAPPRDAIGLVVDTFLDPLTYADIPFEWSFGRTAMRAVDTRARFIETLDEIEETSIDFYATMRSLYRQRRDDEIRDGGPAPSIPIPSISYDFEVDEGEDTASLLPNS